MLRFQVKRRPRKLKGVLIGPGSGPAERIKYLQLQVNKLFRDERVENREDRIQEIRGYAEQARLCLINFFIFPVGRACNRRFFRASVCTSICPTTSCMRHNSDGGHMSTTIRVHTRHPHPEIDKLDLIFFYRSVQMCTHSPSASFINFELLTKDKQKQFYIQYISRMNICIHMWTPCTYDRHGWLRRKADGKCEHRLKLQEISTRNFVDIYWMCTQFRPVRKYSVTHVTNLFLWCLTWNLQR